MFTCVCYEFIVFMIFVQLNVFPCVLFSTFWYWFNESNIAYIYKRAFCIDDMQCWVVVIFCWLEKSFLLLKVLSFLSGLRIFQCIQHILFHIHAASIQVRLSVKYLVVVYLFTFYAVFMLYVLGFDALFIIWWCMLLGSRLYWNWNLCCLIVFSFNTYLSLYFCSIYILCLCYNLSLLLFDICFSFVCKVLILASCLILNKNCIFKDGHL